MSRFFFRASIALTLLAYLLLPATARAHETVNFGQYAVVYGWRNEPPVAGEPNAITLTITETSDEAGHGHEEGESPAGAEAGGLVFVAPVDGAAVAGDSVEVTIALAEGSTPAEGQHWHLYVDNELVTMQEFDEPTFMVTGLADGEHRLEARVADAGHAESEDSAVATINVSAGAAEGTPAPAATEAEGHEHGQASSVDVSTLTVTISYGGETRVLPLEPVFGGEPGEYLARVTPVRAGQYTVALSGSLGEETVDAEIEPEEVMGAEVLAFPAGAATGDAAVRAAAAEARANTAMIVGIVGVITGLLGLAVGGLALARRAK
jgi:hypothetical protein